MKLDVAVGDVSSWREVDFALNCTYIVPDQVSHPSFRLPRAMTSIPRNLCFQHGPDNEVTGVFSKEYIPQGTRFGPLQGDVYAKDSVPKQANRKYFWRIYSGGQLQNFIDGFDVHRSNWMRYVNPARSAAEQNLVACQSGGDIFFYTLRPLEPTQELLVWYSSEFAQRLCGRQDDSRHKYLSVDDDSAEPPQRSWLKEYVKEEVMEEDKAELLERDTPPDTPDDQIMDFSKKEEEAEPRGSPSPRPRPLHREPGHAYPPDHAPTPLPGDRPLPLHLHGLYGHREGLVSSYPLYPQPRPLQPPYQLLPPYGAHYPRLLLPPYSPAFPGVLPPRGSLRYGTYLSSDGLPYPPMATPTLLPVYPPSPPGGLKELTPNVSPPRGAPATPELSPQPKPAGRRPSPERPAAGCEEAMNLTLSTAKNSAAPRNGPGHKSLPYPLKKQNGKIKYECNICAKTFGQLSNLKVHLRVHSGERPFQCNLCKKSFTQLAHLQKHHLVHTGEKPHQCQVCQKRFSSTSNLKTHLRLHSGEKPYQCKLCSTKFTQYIHLKLHRRLHSGRDRAFRCQLCTHAFFHRFSLHIHQRGCCPPTAAAAGLAEVLERFDASQEAEALAEAASAAQVEEAAERWLAAGAAEGEGKEDQQGATLLRKALTAALSGGAGAGQQRATPPAYQERASVVHLHMRTAVKMEAQ